MNSDNRSPLQHYSWCGKSKFFIKGSCFNLALRCIENHNFIVWRCNTVLDQSNSWLSNLCIFIIATKQTNYILCCICFIPYLAKFAINYWHSWAVFLQKKLLVNWRSRRCRANHISWSTSKSIQFWLCRNGNLFSSWRPVTWVHSLSVYTDFLKITLIISLWC